MDQVLREAGWVPGRKINPELWLSSLEVEGLRRHAAASTFLSEFGGLAVNISGSGISRSREPFELDPSLCEGEGDRFLEWSDEIGRSVFPIGVLDGGRFFLGIDENSEIYSVETWLGSFGPMPGAMTNLITGVRAEVIDDGDG
ncbi:SUKH-3 domain-containing protein [Streptomyces sp. AK04-3B]|uniref:SUKH-3 domain-containing protein n=1 Tax=Streptomyces sp. AK04-3B TaxID=3028650 RepID=UPI0029AD3E8B|nr:SUKH-3 domain-containing protein [Streptomyces sp. AK04-3B]MDX3801704.1 SUKH-3 domain-containing protein [Streptomyces sp. AK04-3B]